ncbi:MAG: hypothetical protein PWQ16_1324 [bacterium]|nr:MAG: Serine/threonine protein kinase [bacterium 42_11]MDK2871972.1 hypothetical protein [bacterium]
MLVLLLSCLALYSCGEEETGEEIWSFSLSSPIYSSPSIKGDRIVLNGLEGIVACLNGDGGLVWKYKLNDDETILSSPLIEDERVFITSVLNKGKIYCLDLNYGEKFWEYEVSSPIVSSPALYDNKVFFAGTDGTIYAFSWQGSLIWNIRVEGAVYATPAVEDGKLIVGTSTGKVYCINASTGEIIWDSKLESPIELEASIDDSNRVYIVTSSNKLYCLDLDDGTDLWEVSFSSRVCAPPSYSDGKVLIPLSDGSIYAISPRGGSIFWSYKAEDGSPSALCPTDGYVYFVDINGKLYCLNISNGEEKWTHDLGSPAYSSPIAKGERVYIGTVSGKIYCIKGNSSEANWPTFQGNNARTGKEER